jgi:phosphatidylglycerophosphatase A
VSIKESSDELNPQVSVREVVSKKAERGPSDYLALAIATFGVGYLPIAPGTWGSLVGLGIFLLLRFSLKGNPPFLIALLFAIVLITVAGIWAASQTERLSGRKDPGKVVVDEVAGQLISTLPLVLMSTTAWKMWIIISFILFRFFDIVKPYPARQLEGLHGGLGIMCDDLVAGVYAAAIVLVAGFLTASI